MTIDHHMNVSAREGAAAATAPRRGLPSFYVGLWTGLAAIAAGYLTVSAFDGGLNPTGLSPQMVAAISAESSKRAEDNRKLRDALADFQSDVSHVRTDLEQKGSAPETVGALAAIEERASIETGKPVEKRTAFMPASAVPTANGPAVLETGSINPPPPAVKPPVAVTTVAAAPPSAPAAAPAQEITFGAPIVKPAPRPFGVQLGSGVTLDQLRTTWTQLAEENSDALRALQPRYTTTTTDAAGPTYDLLAGPFRSAVDARKVCKTLAARGVDCKVSTFGGDVL